MKYLLLTILIVILSACSFKDYKHSSTNLLTIKTKRLKFSDLAYIRHINDKIEIDLYVAGKAVKQIDINYLICIDDGCITKSKFNKLYLSSYYPDDILQNIFLGKKIFNGKNTTLTPNGFEQKIKDKHIDIKYILKQNKIYFKDRKNKILIKIKRIQDAK